MGLMRRVESSIESAVDEPRPANIVKPVSRRDRGKTLAVQPKELGQKLVKEMDAHKVSRQGRALASNRFIVHLCPQDYDRFAPRLADLIDKLERTALKHVRAEKYELAGDLEVLVVREPDLRAGYFGILAQRVSDGQGPLRPAEVPQQAAAASAAGAAAVARPATSSASAAAVHEMPANRGTKVIPAGQASQMDLAANAIVIRAGGRAREFTRSRVILGRARDADFQLDDPNVSRRHAALYWSEGRVMVEDLDSTNGTMVNGYPISSTVLRPKDVLVIGDTRIDVEIKSR